MQGAGWRDFGTRAPGGRAIGLAVILFAAAILGTGPASAQVADAIGSVTAAVGQASVIRFTQTTSTSITEGAKVFEGDRLRTAAGAKLQLKFVDGTTLRLGENTELALDWFLHAPDQGTRNVLLRVPAGIIRTIVDLVLPHSTFEVQTNTAVASVRGTDWIAEATPDATAIVALDGQVGVRNEEAAIGGQVVLGPGDGTTVRTGQPPSAPTQWGAARKSSFIERTALP
jgi:hypothetical protein